MIMKELIAREGYYLTTKNKDQFYKAIFGHLNEEDYIEISEEEVKKIKENQE